MQFGISFVPDKHRVLVSRKQIEQSAEYVLDGAHVLILQPVGFLKKGLIRLF